MKNKKNNLLTLIAIGSLGLVGCGGGKNFSGEVISEKYHQGKDGYSKYNFTVKTDYGTKIVNVDDITIIKDAFIPSTRYNKESIDELINVGDSIDFKNFNPETKVYSVTADVIANSKKIDVRKI